MSWIKDTISKRLFLAFSVLAVNVILISSLSYHFISSSRRIHELTHHLEDQRIQIVRLLKLDLDFLRFEILNQEFYRTNHSSLINKRDSVMDRIHVKSTFLHRKLDDDSPQIKQYLHIVDSNLHQYNNTFYQIVEKVKVRGIKDYGMEGTMRKYAHELENHSTEVSMADILSLRRHEKDFFLRKDLQYKTKFNAMVDMLIDRIAQDNTDEFVVYLLESYRNAFNKLSSLEEEIGILPSEGLLGQLDDQTNQLSEKLEVLVQLYDAYAEKIIEGSLMSTIIIGLASMQLSFILTYFTSIRLARPIKKLSNTIGQYMVTQGLKEEDLTYEGATHEIINLSDAFIKLTRKLRNQFDEIQRKSHLLETRNLELHKLNEELDRFIYSSAHDLKSPLASMSGLIYLAQKEVNLPEFHHYFDKMNTSINKMDGFIRDITDYAKNKRQEILVEPIVLEKILDDIFESLEFIPNNNKIYKSLKINVDEFHTDRTRLEIILKNIISNAIRYSDFKKDDSFIRIGAEKKEDNLIITIEDNGIGIGAQHVPKIFDMFYRAIEHSKGSGIGLFLVRESVKMVRGTISVHSLLGSGTTFVLTLPCLKQVNVNQLPESQPLRSLAPQID